MRKNCKFPAQCQTLGKTSINGYFFNLLLFQINYINNYDYLACENLFSLIKAEIYRKC